MEKAKTKTAEYRQAAPQRFTDRQDTSRARR